MGKRIGKEVARGRAYFERIRADFHESLLCLLCLRFGWVANWLLILL